MAYTKTNWGSATPINTANLNKIENGIYDNDTNITTNTANITTNTANIGTLSNLTTTEKGSLVGAVNENVNGIKKIGKKLWTGNWKTGSITVPGYSNYDAFAFNVDGVLCFGNRAYGCGGYTTYASYTNSLRSYRVASNGDVLSITNEDKGGSDGTTNIAIKDIYGLF